MAFVYDTISDSDIEKYNLKDIAKRTFLGLSIGYKWVIDRDRDSYFIYEHRGRDEENGRLFFLFYCKGKIYRITLMILKDKTDNKSFNTFYVPWIDIIPWLNPRLETEVISSEEANILKDGILSYALNETYGYPDFIRIAGF